MRAAERLALCCRMGPQPLPARSALNELAAALGALGMVVPEEWDGGAGMGYMSLVLEEIAGHRATPDHRQRAEPAAPGHPQPLRQ